MEIASASWARTPPIYAELDPDFTLQVQNPLGRQHLYSEQVVVYTQLISEQWQKGFRSRV